MILWVRATQQVNQKRKTKIHMLLLANQFYKKKLFFAVILGLSLIGEIERSTRGNRDGLIMNYSNCKLLKNCAGDKNTCFCCGCG